MCVCTYLDAVLLSFYVSFIVIDHIALRSREIMCLVASVHPFVCSLSYINRVAKQTGTQTNEWALPNLSSPFHG